MTWCNVTVTSTVRDCLAPETSILSVRQEVGEKMKREAESRKKDTGKGRLDKRKDEKGLKVTGERDRKRKIG